MILHLSTSGESLPSLEAEGKVGGREELGKLDVHEEDGDLGGEKR